MVAIRYKDLPPARDELVARLRREIESGRYDTPERLDAALDRLIGRAARR